MLEAEQEKFILGVTSPYRCYDVSDETQQQQKASQALEYFIVQVNNIHLNQLQQTSETHFLVSVQILDGIGAGIFGVLSVLMVADLAKGTGRFNVTQGMLNTAIGVGAGLSNVKA